jgi:hypothetical protein
MRLGDSFTLSLDLPAWQRVQSAASKYKKRHPEWDYATRLEPENRCVRVWRIQRVW